MFFLYLRKWNFLAPRLRMFLYFLKKSFSYFLGNGTFNKKFLYFMRELYAWKMTKMWLWKKHLYLGKWSFLARSLKNSYLFLIRNCFIFQEGTCKAWKTKIYYACLIKIYIFNFIHQNFFRQNILFQNQQKKFLCRQ